nr:MAG TPA: hypothetical protein [Caudoviricetes sp.]
MLTSAGLLKRFNFEGCVYTIYTVAKSKGRPSHDCVYCIYPVYTLCTAEQSFERSRPAL